MNILSVTTILLAFVTALTVAEPQGVEGPDTGRKASTVLVQSAAFATEAAVSIGFSQPVWRDSYDEMLPKLTGRYIRLGNGWWSTLDTIGTIEIGGVRVAPGSYFVGLARAADGTFSLLLFDSRKAMQLRLLPYTTALYRGEAKADFTAPLTFGKGVLAASVCNLISSFMLDCNTTHQRLHAALDQAWKELWDRRRRAQEAVQNADKRIKKANPAAEKLERA